MAIEKVRAYFKQYNMDNEILEFDTSSATVELAAQSLHCEPAHMPSSSPAFVPLPMVKALL